MCRGAAWSGFITKNRPSQPTFMEVEHMPGIVLRASPVDIALYFLANI